MLKNSWLYFCFFMSLSACSSEGPFMDVNSPDGRIALTFLLTEAGQPAYVLHRDGQVLLDTSTLGLSFRDWPDMKAGFRLVHAERHTLEEAWQPVWGETASIRNHYNELLILLEEKQAPYRQWQWYFRAYDDGIAFRYVLPAQGEVEEVVLMDEHSRFQLTADHQCWWIPGDWDIYEHLYASTRVSGIDALARRKHPSLAQTYIPENAVNTPATMKSDEGLYLSFHEAALTDYAGMTLRVDTNRLLLESELVGAADGSKVRARLPLTSPWRTVQIADRAGDLIQSHLILNLNEPSRLDSTDWIQPMKYMGIWWEMHLGESTWDMASGRHGATTENARRYIDFCAQHGIPALLIEGWNTGWERWIGFEDREGVFDFVTPYSDFDLEGVVAYAREKGVELIGHHETSAAVRTYEQQMDTAFQLYRRLGIRAVKTGYVGPIIPTGEYHHGQYMVNHYRRVVETAARFGLMVNAHEPIKATGIRRTWPNMMTREGMRGQEFNAWSEEGGNPLEHTLILPFTRMLAGPMDYTPGVFNLRLSPYKPDHRVRHTLAHELALYVVFYSPLQMVADLPGHLAGQPGLEFVKSVGVDWSESRVLEGEIGQYITVARRDKASGHWFLGALTGQQPRRLSVSLDFLEQGREYVAVLYADGPDAHWDTRPEDLEISEQPVKGGDNLEVLLAPGGGLAVHFRPR